MCGEWSLPVVAVLMGCDVQKIRKVQITVEEEDGRLGRRTLEGDEAERWGRACANAAVFLSMHGHPFDSFPWTQEASDGQS